MDKTFIPDSQLVLNADGSVYHLKLFPEQIADALLLVGDPNRVKKISAYFDTIEHKVSNRELITHTGFYKGKRITVLSTGMGTDNIDIVINELDALVNIDLKTRTIKKEHTRLKLIRLGTSGALQPEIPVGDSFVASRFALGLADSEMNHKIESFEFEGLKITNFEMESSALYGLSNMLGHDALTICVIIANRVTEKFAGDYQIHMDKLIKNTLDRLAD